MGKGHEADGLTGFSEITDAAESTLINSFFKLPILSTLLPLESNYWKVLLPDLYMILKPILLLGNLP